MDIYRRKFSLSNFSPTRWFNHPGYFIFWFAVGVFFWTLSFENKKIEYDNIQLSSFAENLREIQNAEAETINRLPAEKNQKKELPKRFKGNPAFQVFEHIERLVNEK